MLLIKHLLVTCKSYFFGLKMVFGPNFWKFFPREAKNIIIQTSENSENLEKLTISVQVEKTFGGIDPCSFIPGAQPSIFLPF